MDLRNLETFISVAETKSFSRSAKALGLTQPAVSKRIAALEIELSVQLFDRIGRQPELTEAGRKLFPQAKHIQAELSSIKEALANHDTEIKGTLVLSTTACTATNELSSILKQFQTSFPEVRIDLRLGNDEEVLELINSNAVELAICPLYENSLAKIPPAYSCVGIWNSVSRVVVAAEHPLTRKTHLTTEDLRNSKAILPPNGSLAESVILDAVADGSATSLDIAARADDLATMCSLATMDMGWTCIPDNRIDDAIKALNIEGLELRHSITLIRKRDRTLSRAASAFINTLPFNTNTAERDQTTVPSDSQTDKV